MLVHAENERYSLENCILDPLITAMLLLDNTTLGFSNNKFKLDENFTLNNDLELFKTKSQDIVDIIVESIKNKIEDTTRDELRKVEYINGLTVNIPTWFLENQGHDLEEIIKDVFQELKKIGNKGALKSNAIKTMKKYPDFIPKCFLDVMIKIIDN